MSVCCDGERGGVLNKSLQRNCADETNLDRNHVGKDPSIPIMIYLKPKAHPIGLGHGNPFEISEKQAHWGAWVTKVIPMIN